MDETAHEDEDEFEQQIVERERLEQELHAVQSEVLQRRLSQPAPPAGAASLSPLSVAFEDYQKLHALMDESEKAYASEIVLLAKERDDLAKRVQELGPTPLFHSLVPLLPPPLLFCPGVLVFVVEPPATVRIYPYRPCHQVGH